MAARVFLLSRWLEPVAAGLWIFFLVWTAFIAVVWSCGLGDGTLAQTIGNRDLRAALEWLIGVGDIVWITLAAANTHLWLAETEGLATARRWALTVLGGAAALAALSVWTGFPLGAIRYSAPLGVKLGPVPLGLPLLWFALIIGARQIVLRIWPKAGPTQLAAMVGGLALLTEYNLEPVAAKVRGFWFWSASTPFAPPLFTPPWTNYAAWAVAAAALTFALREERVAAGTRVSAARPLTIFVVLNAVFLVANLGRWLRA
jgi:uncharacterized membrane protein